MLSFQTAFANKGDAVCVTDLIAIAMRAEIVVRFEYGSIASWVSRQDDRQLEFIVGCQTASTGVARSQVTSD